MVQLFTHEWQIAKSYIYDVVLHHGMINLDWRDFEYFAENYHPLFAVRNEGDASIKELLDRILEEVRVHGADNFSKIIISLSFKEGEGIDMEEMSAVNDFIDAFMTRDRDMEIKWGVNQYDSLESKHCVSVFAFE